MARLDKSKPYGETMGLERSIYHQGGKDFDAEGDEIIAVSDTDVPDETAAQSPTPKPKSTKPKAKYEHPQGIE